jgi:hypothetical protein
VITELRRQNPTIQQDLCVHALLVKLYSQHLVAESEIPPARGTKGFEGRNEKANSVEASFSVRCGYARPNSSSAKPPVAPGPAGSGAASALSPLVVSVGASMWWVEPVTVNKK